MMASKFATGASVSKTAAGEEEIVIQGDVGDEVVSRLFLPCRSLFQVEMLRAQVKELKGAPADQVVRVCQGSCKCFQGWLKVDEKNKKAAEETA